MSANYVKNTTGPKKNDPVNLLSGASTDNVTGKTIDPNSYGANVGGVTPAPTVDASSYGAMGPAPKKVSTYGEFLTSKEAMAKSTYDSTVKRLDDLNAETLAKIESDRQKGVRNAGNAYEQSKASYGSNAEALRRMGLSGSGYSDYLESSAYAASRSEIGAINAGATESARAANSETEKNKFDALNTYNANISEIASERAKFEESERLRAEEEDAAKKTAFQTLLTNINSGIYTDYDQIQKLAADAGLSAEEAQQLVNAAADYSTKSQETKAKDGYRSILAEINNGLSDYDQIIKFAAEEGLSLDEAQQLVNYAAQLDAKDKAISAGEDAELEGDVVGGIRADIGAGNISFDEGVRQLTKIQTDWFAEHYENQIKDPQNINDTLMAQAKKDYNSGRLSEDAYNEIKGAYDEKYSVHFDHYTKDGAITSNYYVDASQNLNKPGNNFTTYVNGTTYKLESGGRVEHSTTLSALQKKAKAKNVSDSRIFEYGGQLYIKKGNNFYYIDGRNGDKNKKNGYNDLLALFK